MNARKTDVTLRLPAIIPPAPSPASATLAIVAMDFSAHLVRFGEPDEAQKTLAPSMRVFYSLQSTLTGDQGWFPLAASFTESSLLISILGGRGNVLSVVLPSVPPVVVSSLHDLSVMHMK